MSAGRALRAKTWLWLAAALIPPAVIACIIAHYGIDVPYWDDWAMAAFLVKVHRQGVSFGDLVAIHNEGRLVVPRILALIEAEIVHWDKRASMVMSLVFASIAAVAWYRVARRTLIDMAPGAVALASLYLFSILQMVNWLWAFQTALFIPGACLAGGVWVAGANIGGRAKVAATIGISVVATYSFTNGMFLWLLLPPLLWIGRGVSRRALLRIWPIAAAVTLIPYFIHFKRAGWVPTWGDAMTRPLEATQYVLAFLGMPLGWNNRGLASITCAIAGGLLVTLLVIAIVYTWRRGGDDREEFVHRMAPWLTLAIYAVMCACAAAVGRATGVNALVLRYVTFSTNLIVAVIFLAMLIGQDLRARRPDLCGKIKFAWRALAIIALVANVVMLPELAHRLRLFRAWHLSSKGATELIALGESSAMHQRIDPFETQSMAEQIFAVDEAGLMSPGIVRDLHLTSGPLTGTVDRRETLGVVERNSHDDNGYSLSGWAVLPWRKDPADCVIIGADLADGSTIAVAFADQFDDRPEVASALGQSCLTCGWVTTVPVSAVPRGAKGLSVWAFDATTGKAYRLEQSSP